MVDRADSGVREGKRAASSLLPIVAMLGSVVSLSIGASLAKKLLPVVGATGAVALRVAGATLFLGLLWRPWQARLGRADWRALARYGVTVGVMNLLFYHALKTLPLGIATAIEFTGPLVVALASSRRVLDFGWIGLAALGLISLLPHRASAASLDPTGVAFALGAAVCWALYIVFGKRLGHLHGGRSVALGMAIASTFTIPLGFAAKGTALLAPGTLLLGMGVATLSTALPYSLEMVALKRLPKQAFGVMLSMDPALGALAAFFILGERLTPTQWIAILCIMAASVGMSLTAEPDTPKPSDLEPHAVS